MDETVTKDGFIGKIKLLAKRYFIDALSSMAMGLFGSLIIGLIISQLAKIPGLDFLMQFAEVAQSGPVVGAAIGVAVAYGLKRGPLVMFSCAVVGAIGYITQSAGPVGCYVSVLVGAELAGLIAGKTKMDIVVVPLVAILTGGLTALLVGPGVAALMSGLGNFVNEATRLQPFFMGIVVSVVVGMVLTAPISSAALCISLGIEGLAAGAAVVGCCCNMVGFAVASWRDNRWGGLIAQGLGTSMLQVGNIVRKPLIWVPAIAASAILGPVSTCVFGMTNTSVGAGMGTSGLVGQFGAWAAMSGTVPPLPLLGQILLMHFLLPGVIAYLATLLMRKTGAIKDGDMKLSL